MNFPHIHKWTDDAIYASFFAKDGDNYRSLHKFTFFDQKYQIVLDEENNSIDTLEAVEVPEED